MGEPGTTSPSNEFDPASVPPYPVITLTGADDPDNVTVDQQRFEGEDAFEQALKVCVARAEELGGAVRVRGVDRDGTEWPMVVTTDGQLHDLPPVETAESRARAVSRRRLILGGAIAAGSLVLLGAGAGGVVAWNAAHQTPPPAPPPVFPGKGANLPVVPPGGASTIATWAVVIDSDAKVQMLPTGRLAFLSSEGELVIINAANGQLQWSGAAPNSTGTLRVFEGDDASTLANATNRGLDLWDLSDQSTPAPFHFDARKVDATVLATGDGILYDLGEQTAELYFDGEMVLLDVPVPAVAAGVRGGAAVAVNHTEWVQIDPDNTATPTALEDVPDEARIEAARVLGTDILACQWATEDGSYLTGHTLPEGSNIGTIELRNGSTNGTVLAAPNGQSWVWNGVLITAEGLALMDDYTPDNDRLDALLVTDTEVWGTIDQTLARLTLATREFTLEEPDATAPVATHDNLAYIVATKLEDTILHAVELPSTPSGDPSDGGGDTTTASDGGAA